MAKKELILPKQFTDQFGTHPQHKGKMKLSYSQYSSYKDPEYQDQYYLQYFSGISLPSGEFAEFGTSCGQFIEDVGQGMSNPRVGCLSKEDIEILLNKVDFPPNCIYEDEVVVDFGDFVCEGYIDRAWYKENNEVEIRDYKSLNLDKPEKYESEEYGQTTLYSLEKERKGFKVVNSEVFGLGRKGSSLEGTGNFKMRLSGEVKVIPTPYSKERGEKILESIRKVAENISDDFKVYKKYFS